MIRLLQVVVFLASSVLLPCVATAQSSASLKEQCASRRGEQAIAACTKLLEGRLSGLDKVNAYQNRGIALWRLGAHTGNQELCDQGIVSLTLAIELNRSLEGQFDFWGLGDRANAWSDCKGNYLKALEDLDAAIASFPLERKAPLYITKGGILRQMGELVLARVTYEQGLASKPSPHRKGLLLANRALLWKDLGQLDRALVDANEAVKFKPTNEAERGYWAFMISVRSEIWRHKGDLQRSLEDVRKAAEASPGAYHSQHGDVLRYMGQFDAALDEYNKALSIRADNPAALVERGLVFERKGDLVRARADFGKALATPGLGLGSTKDAHKTARARLDALNSGTSQPIIPVIPAVTDTNAIPTPIVTPSSGEAVVATDARKVALIVGNASYKHAGALANPLRDAEVVAAALRRLGFATVTLLKDATRQEMVGALRAFASEVEKADWAIVYFAGHGIEVGGINYLLPVDTRLVTDTDAQFETVPLDHVLTAMEQAKKLRLVLLDACRNNPFVETMRRTIQVPTAMPVVAPRGITDTRSVVRGLSDLSNVLSGTLVVYAAKHGQTALDGTGGGNSPFVVALVQRLGTPGIEINKVFRLIRDDVMEATAGRQEPYTYGSLPGREDFYFLAAR